MAKSEENKLCLKFNFTSSRVSRKIQGASYYPIQKPEFSKIKKPTINDFKEYCPLKYICVGYIFCWSRFWTNSFDLEALLTTCVHIQGNMRATRVSRFCEERFLDMYPSIVQSFVHRRSNALWHCSVIEMISSIIYIGFTLLNFS